VPIKWRGIRVAASSVILDGMVGLFGLIVVNTFVLDRLGVPLIPAILAPVTALEVALGVVIVRPQLWRPVDTRELAGVALTLGAVFLFFFLPSLPSLYPPTSSGDSMLNLLVVNYIVEHHSLTHDVRALSPYMGEMAAYPFAAHAIVAFIAQALDQFPLRVMHSFISLPRALSAAYIFKMAYRSLPATPQRLLLALCAPIFLYIPAVYFVGSAMGWQYYFAMIFGELIIVSSWHTLFFAYDSHHPLSTERLAFFSLLAVSLAWTYSAWLPLLALGCALRLLLPGPTWKQRVWQAIAAGFPALIALVLFITQPYYAQFGRNNMTYEGGAASPGLGSLGVPFLIVAGTGLLATLKRWQQSWPALVVLGLCLVQGAAFYTLSSILHWIAVYHFYKSVQIIVYPLALLAALGVAQLANLGRQPDTQWRAAQLVLCVAVAAALLAVRLEPRASPIQVITPDEVAVGDWAKAHIDVTQVGYRTAHAITGYWLHIGILGNRRDTPNATTLLTLPVLSFDEWLNGGTRPSYLIVDDASTVPQAPGVTTVYSHGKAVLLKRAVPQNTVVVEHPQRANLDNYLQILGYSGPLQTLQPGSWFVMDVDWQALYWPPRFIAHYMYVHIVTDAGTSVAGADKQMLAEQYTRLHWPLDFALTERFMFQLPAEMPAGRYYAKVGVYPGDTESDLWLTDANGKPMDRLLFGPFRVALPAAQGTPQVAVNRTFDQKLALLGYDLPRGSVRTGETLAVRLYWKALTQVSEDYTAFVHLVGKDGRPVAQCDMQPLAGVYPTSIWSAGESVSFDCPVPVAASIAPGDYTLRAGLYNWQTLVRLSLDIGGDAVDLRSIAVAGP
jgi:hypothetical protein